MRIPLATLTALLCLASAPLAAQTLYRCGNTYQDKPCQGEPGRIVVEAESAPRAVPPPRPVDEICRQQGDAAALLRWEKEGGRTEAEQIRRDPDNTRFIRYVYAKLGSALDVRRLVEADCMDSRARGLQSGPQAAPAVGGFVMALPRAQASSPPASNEPRRGGGIGNDSGSDRPSRNIDSALCRTLALRERAATDRQQASPPPTPAQQDELRRELREVAELRQGAQCPTPGAPR